MSVNRELLKDFLATNGCQDPEGALAPLDSLFKIAESGQYPLAPVEEIDQENLMEVISLATGRPVSKVTSISLDSPFLKLGRFDQKAYKTGIAINLVGGSACFKIGVDYSNFRANIKTSLWDSFESSFEVSFGDVLWANLKDDIKLSIWYSVFRYLTFCLLNNQEKIYILGLFVKFWSQCLILGFKQDEPETLLVICK